MKTRKSFAIIALLLVAAGCGCLDSSKRKAFQALDEAVRLYESGSDTLDPGLLAPALAYFPEKGDAA